MRYLDEFQDPVVAGRLLDEIAARATRQWTIMEVCGGQTHSIIRNGIDQLLPPTIELVHGPGCPVCVTPLATIDRALAIAARPEVVLCTFGDMLRVPGSHDDLSGAKADGADVRVVYSPLDAVRLAEQLTDREVVFLAIGFETTAPASAMAVHQAWRRGIDNFSLLVSHVLVPPAIEAIASSPTSRIDGFLAAGHVCSVMGTRQYRPLAERLAVPIVVTGFEPVDLLEGIRRVVAQLEAGDAQLDNAYERAVTDDGNVAAQRMLDEVFEVCNQTWRGIGEIPASGWRLRPELDAWNAELKFDVAGIDAPDPAICRAGEVLQGLVKPPECEAFGVACTPRTPLGAPMVSSEGACAAYHQYRRLDRVEPRGGPSV